MPGKALPTHARPRSKGTESADADADWGAKTYRGVRADGTAWEKVTRWFGYKLHLIVDAVHELPLSHAVTRESGEDAAHRLVFPESADSPVHTFDGRVFRRLDEQGNTEMAFAGFEKGRGCLKYRCPAAAYGFVCPERERCGTSKYGRVVRIPLSADRRVFTPLARSSYAWESAYRRRTSVERVNARVDQVYGFEKHFIRGLKKMRLRVSLALVVMLAMALGRLKTGQTKQYRSLIQPAARAGAA